MTGLYDITLRGHYPRIPGARSYISLRTEGWISTSRIADHNCGININDIHRSLRVGIRANESPLFNSQLRGKKSNKKMKKSNKKKKNTREEKKIIKEGKKAPWRDFP